MTVAVGDEESFDLSVVIFNGDAHRSFPDIVNSGSSIAFDHFVGLLQVSHKVFSEV